MSPARVRKQLLCPECGRVLKVVETSAARVGEENLPEDDAMDEVVGAPGVPEVIETVAEYGPICPRCAG